MNDAGFEVRFLPSNRTGLHRLWGRGTIPKGTVRPDGVVVLPPLLDQHLGLEQRVERFSRQQLVPEGSAEQDEVHHLERAACAAACSDSDQAQDMPGVRSVDHGQEHLLPLDRSLPQ